LRNRTAREDREAERERERETEKKGMSQARSMAWKVAGRQSSSIREVEEGEGVGECDAYGQYQEHGQRWEHGERAFSAGNDNEMSLVKTTDSTRIYGACQTRTDFWTTIFTACLQLSRRPNVHEHFQDTRAQRMKRPQS
jgi:hypothetical protein